MNTVVKDVTSIAEIELKESISDPANALVIAETAAAQSSDTPTFLPQTGIANIAGAIASVMEEVGVVAKDGTNKFHNYAYAKMEDVLKRITPLMGRHGLAVIQTELDRTMFDDDKAIAVRYSFTICHKSGEVWPERPIQTGLSRCRDSKGGFDDKAFNKAHTAARKYFLLALFQIPTGDDEEIPDADKCRTDAQDDERKPRVLKKDHRARYNQMQAAIETIIAVADLLAWGKGAGEEIAAMPEDWQENLRRLFDRRHTWLKKKEAGEDPGEFKNLAEEWAEKQGDRLRNATGAHKPDADGVIWEEAGERAATPADEIADPTPAPKANGNSKYKSVLLSDISKLDTPRDCTHWSVEVSASAKFQALPEADRNQVFMALMARQSELMTAS